MSFNSLFFLFSFLPIVLLTTLALKKDLRNTFLLLASLFFYAWGEKEAVFLLISMSFMNYCFGLLIEKGGRYLTPRRALYISIIFNLGFLAFLKYTAFAVENLNSLLGVFNMPQLAVPQIYFPVGVSFFTFQALTYVVDIYRRDALPQRNPVNAMLYISMFPQLLSGPIIKYRDIAAKISERTLSVGQFSSGVRKFIAGMSKKVLIADTLAPIANDIFSKSPDEFGFSVAWLGIISYTLQLYFDFSGYSDMAIGLARMLGFDFAENFNYPYVSQSVREFWRRWHISLSTWIRDYLYIPIGGNRGSHSRTMMNLLFVFFLTGLWHGASWTFIIWGLFHGTFLILERGALGKFLERVWIPVRHSYTILIVMVGWVFFRSETLPYALDFLKNMAGLGPASAKYYFPLFLNNETTFTLIAAPLFAIPVLPWIRGRLPMMTARLGCSGNAPAAADLLYAVAFAVCILAIAGSTNNPFIYFRF